MEDFIKNHRKLSIAVFTVVVIVLIVWLIISTVTKTSTTSSEGVSQTGDADSSTSLDYSNPLFSIVQDPNHPENLKVQAYQGYRNAAIREIYDQGYDPTNYKITFDYESPFTPYE